jgi:membrane protein
MLNHPLVRMVQLVLDKYQRDNVGGLSAALAYFTIFSIFPLLLVVISMVGFFVDPSRINVEEQLLALIGSPEVRDLIAQALSHFTETRVGVGLLGVGTLLFAATGIFGALTRTFKVIWEARIIAGSGTFKVALITMVVEKLVAFGLLAGCAALIMASVVGNFALTLLSAYTDWLPMNAILLRLAQLSLMIGLLTVAFAVLYKVLPDRLPAWGDVWPAAFVAAVAFTALQELAELIFSRVNFSSFGVLGGAMTVLLWIYLCAQILLVGGELSYAWAHVLGSKREPAAR